MDESNGRGEANGYEPLADEMFDLKNAPDCLNLPFTSSYTDIAAKRAWTDGLPAAVSAANEAAERAETEGLAAAEAEHEQRMGDGAPEQIN